MINHQYLLSLVLVLLCCSLLHALTTKDDNVEYLPGYGEPLANEVCVHR
jgi:hypothetical protein